MTWESLLPPAIVFLLGIWTRRVQLSLFAGVLSAALLACGFDPLGSAGLAGWKIWENSGLGNLTSRHGFLEAGNFLILAFVVILGILIEMIRQSHAAEALVRFAAPRIRDRRAAETGALLLSHSLCIDDYLSSLTVGSVMRPLSDKLRIPRAKLALLADSMAAPIAIITPISSWAAAIIGFLNENGVHTHPEPETILHANPYSVYLGILPYVFYSLALIATIWFVVRKSVRLGSMRQQEELAETTGDLAGGKRLLQAAPEKAPCRQPTMADFCTPVFSLLAAALFFLLYLGGWQLFGGSRNLVETLQNAPISLVLFSAGSLSLLFSSAVYLYRGTFPLKRLAAVAKDGVKLMFPVSIMLLLAWTMGDLLREELRTGEWLASLLSGTIPLAAIPLIFFWNATLIALALGSSWATTAILFPIAIPMVVGMSHAAVPTTAEQLPILFPVFGAILSGAVCGNHISLISDTTIMAATSSGCDLMDHTKTQLPYALPAFVGASAGFLLAGLFAGSGPALALTLALSSSVVIALALTALMGRQREALWEPRSSSPKRL